MVLVLLATHNGAAYLPQFLQSLEQQSLRNWNVAVRDDESTDDTRAILQRFAARDGRLTILADDHGRQGACQNFGALMQHAWRAGAEYVVFADQDDIWLPDKLERQLACMRKAESAHGWESPHLVYSDLTVVDRQSRVIHPSFSRFAGVYRDDRDPLRSLLVYNCVTGCASLLNRPLLEASLPLPRDAVMHDWWVALCAAAFGRIHFLREPTVLYRQHGSNLVGARGFWKTLNPLATCWRAHWDRAMTTFLRSGQQARALARRLHERDAARHRRELDLVEQYCQALEVETAAWRRVAAVRQLRIGRLNLFRQMTLAARLWTMPRGGLAAPCDEPRFEPHLRPHAWPRVALTTADGDMWQTTHSAS